MKKISLQQAYELSLSKWTQIRYKVLHRWGVYKAKSDDYMTTGELIMGDISEQDEFINLICGCGYCHLNYHKECKGCPLNINEVTPCWIPHHPFSNFCAAETKEKALEAVQALIDLIEQTKPQKDGI